MFAAYKVAIELAVINHASTALTGIISQVGKLNQGFLTAQGGADALQRKLSSIKTMGAIGAGLGLVGFGMLHAMKGPLEEAEKFDKIVARFKLFGLGDKLNEDAVKFAKAMDVYGSSYTQNMKLMTEAQGVFRESGIEGPKALEGAKIASPLLAKIHFATSALDDETKQKMRHSSMEMLRFVEMRGGLNVDKRYGPTPADNFTHIANEGWKAIQSSGGNVDWAQMRQFMRTGRTYAANMSDEALFSKFEPLIGEMKGAPAGTALTTASDRLQIGKGVSNQSIHELFRLGLWDKDKVILNNQGGVKRFKEGQTPFRYSEQMTADPINFYEQYVKPRYNSLGITTVAQIAAENTRVFGGTGGQLFTLIDKQLATIAHSVEARKKTLGIDESVNVAKKTMAGSREDLEAKWTNAKMEFGMAILPLAIEATQKLTSALKWLTSAMEDNPKKTRAVAVAFVALGAALAVGGTILLVSAGLRGLGIALSLVTSGGASIGGLGTAIGALVSPIGIVLLALGTLTLAMYAFRGLTQQEVDSQKTEGGVKLSPEAAQRSATMGWKLPTPSKLKDSGVGPQITFPQEDPNGYYAQERKRAEQQNANKAKDKTPPRTGIQDVKLPANQIDQLGELLKKPIPTPALDKAKIAGTPAKPSNTNYVPQVNKITVNVTNKIDKNGIATMVSQEQEKAMSRPQSGPSTFDSSMNLRNLGAGFAGAF